MCKWRGAYKLSASARVKRLLHFSKINPPNTAHTRREATPRRESKNPQGFTRVAQTVGRLSMKIHGLIKNVTPKLTLCQHVVGEQSTIVTTENESEITCRQCQVRLTPHAADVCHSCGARYVLHALYCHRCGTRR